MADAVLLRWRELRGRALVRWHEEQRVVTETIGSTWRTQDVPAPARSREDRLLASAYVRHHAHELCAAFCVGRALEQAQQLLVVLRIGRVVAGEACGSHTGCAVE